MIGIIAIFLFSFVQSNECGLSNQEPQSNNKEAQNQNNPNQDDLNQQCKPEKPSNKTQENPKFLWEKIIETGKQVAKGASKSVLGKEIANLQKGITQSVKNMLKKDDKPSDSINVSKKNDTINNSEGNNNIANNVDNTGNVNTKNSPKV